MQYSTCCSAPSRPKATQHESHQASLCAARGAPKRCAGRGGGRSWTPPRGPSVELPIGASKRCAGWGGRMWTPPLGPQ
eukprot:5316452-Pyramimonas_sp.AAC.1